MAKLRAAADGKTLRQVLEGFALNQYSLINEGGRWIISTSEAGGVTSFGEASGIKPGLVAELIGRALDWLDAQGTDNPTDLPVKARRVRACFSGRVLS
ncbi:MAG: hypothetical protein J0L84_03170 [Verrucomicrobia bacterium]|nr:hypothetical protein [Verrucomicrobiota bacterium]